MAAQYLYGEFSDEQMKANAKLLHAECHKLLVYKDENITEKNFANDAEFMTYFHNLLERIGGMNTLLGEPDMMVSLMSTLQAAYDMCNGDNYDYRRFRRLILDSHGILTQMFGDVRHA